jgi:GntR family transcriptional regulator
MQTRAMDLRLDPAAPLPLRIQVEQRLRRLIDEPEYRAGKMLPEEIELARLFGVSRTTVRAGIANLVTDGSIERRRGHGTRVAASGERRRGRATAAKKARGLSIDPRSLLPLHAQIEQLLRQIIREPSYRDGGLLPDEVGLAKHLGVARSTVRAAIHKLVIEGLIARKRGVGTRVVRRPITTQLAAWDSFTQEMEARGVVVCQLACEIAWVEAAREVCVALELAPGTRVLRLDRLRGTDQEPAVHFRSWFHPSVGLTGREDFSRPLYRLLEDDFGVVPMFSSEEIAALAADATLARRLNIDRGAPVLVRRRTVSDASRRPIEFAVCQYRSDRFVYNLEIRRDRKGASRS